MAMRPTPTAPPVIKTVFPGASRTAVKPSRAMTMTTSSVAAVEKECASGLH